MSKYISKTKSKIIFKEIAEKEIENLKQGDPMSNKILADIIARREALRAQQAQRSSEKQRMLQAIHNHKASAQQPNLDEFEKEYEAFIAEQRRLKEEREAKEAAAKEAGYTDIYNKSLITLTAFEKLMGKEAFAEILGQYVTKPAGKLTLVPVSDKRPEVTVNTVNDEFMED